METFTPPRLVTVVGRRKGNEQKISRGKRKNPNCANKGYFTICPPPIPPPHPPPHPPPPPGKTKTGASGRCGAKREIPPRYRPNYLTKGKATTEFLCIGKFRGGEQHPPNPPPPTPPVLSGDPGGGGKKIFRGGRGGASILYRKWGVARQACPTAGKRNLGANKSK